MEPPKTDLAILESAFRTFMRGFFTMLPVEILEYEDIYQCCTIRPLIKFPFVNGVGDIRYVDPPVMKLVPLAIPGSSASRQTIKVAEGDYGLYFVSTFSLHDVLHSFPDVAEPRDPAQNALGSGFVMPIDFFLAGKSTIQTNPDRVIEGTDIRVGDPVAAVALAKLASVQSAVNSLAAKINTIALALNGLTGGVFPATLYTDTAPNPTPVLTPTVAGTSHLTAS